MNRIDMELCSCMCFSHTFLLLLCLSNASYYNIHTNKHADYTRDEWPKKNQTQKIFVDLHQHDSFWSPYFIGRFSCRKLCSFCSFPLICRWNQRHVSKFRLFAIYEMKFKRHLCTETNMIIINWLFKTQSKKITRKSSCNNNTVVHSIVQFATRKYKKCARLCTFWPTISFCPNWYFPVR